MPILWRYIIRNFLKIVIASVFAFVAILLTMQLDNIAHFAALGAPFDYILLFTFHQIPYILPIALPLSCLIASLILVQRLSNTHELTALRASGFALRDILAPLWLTAAFLTAGNFWITSELSTHSHLQSNLLKNELRSINPLLLLHSKHLMRLKGFYFDALGASRVGETSADVVLAFPNRYNQRLNLMIAKNLKSSPSSFIGEGVTLISGMASEKENDFDPLLVENMERFQTHVRDFSDILQRKVWAVNNDYLQMPLLLARIKEQMDLLPKRVHAGEGLEQWKQISHQLNRSLSEVIKRFSIAIAVFSFTLMGTAFGLHIGRQKNYFPLYYAIGLTTLYLVAFFVAKGADHNSPLAATLYLAPHLIIISASLLTLRRISKGVEG